MLDITEATKLKYKKVSKIKFKSVMRSRNDEIPEKIKIINDIYSMEN